MDSSVNLNIDILHLILDRSDQNTVSKIMKTCRFLNREGVKYLLSTIPTISNESEALSFLQFVLPTRQSADFAHRLRWIDSLHVLVLDEAEIQAVAKVLKSFFVLVAPQAPNFSILEIDYAERFFAADPELPASIASLTTLDFLTLDDAGEKTVMVLRDLQSSLTKVAVHFDIELGPSAQEDQDPISFLRRSEDTLRWVSLRRTVSSPTGGCYRSVRMLTLNDIDVPTTRHFVHAFPNLQCLRATECMARHELDADAVVLRQRDINVAEQARDGSWSGLTSYKGSILMLYGLGLACQVSHVYVRDDDDEGMEPRQIQAVLGDTRPLHLTIAVRGVEYFLTQADDFVELSASREFGRLPSLLLDLNFRRGSWDADMGGLMNLVYDAIAPSPVPAVTLIINISSATTKPPTYHSLQRHGSYRPSHETPSAPSPVKLYLDSLDPDTVADRLFTGNPSRCAVKVVFIQTWRKQVTAQRGDPGLIMDHDFDQYF
ncbi:hypothetical protein V8D89_007686 [Ganoderma adspersum]